MADIRSNTVYIRNITFYLNSSNSELQVIKTNPKDSGSNHNITLVINFNVMLPVDLTYVPSLQCEVFDYIS